MTDSVSSGTGPGIAPVGAAASEPATIDDFRHGATDSLSDPDADFSTNVHPLGPCPGTVAALARADRRRYPDPTYRELKERLGSHHGVAPRRIVVGAGASELVMRLVSAVPGAVLVRDPTFVEYRKAAGALDRTVLRAKSDEEFLALLPNASIAFLCHPNNPDGALHSASFLVRAAAIARKSGCRLVLDLAYAPMARSKLELPKEAEQLWAPNKPMDCAGVRAGYLVASDADFAVRLDNRAASWILSAEGVELLREFVEPATSAWLESTRPEIDRLLANLGNLLRTRGWQVKTGSANFLVAMPPPPWSAAGIASELRERGIRVRDAQNMGLAGWVRLAARPDRELRLLEQALDSMQYPACIIKHGTASI